MHLQLNRRRNNGKQDERNKETERKGKRENLILPTYSLTVQRHKRRKGKRHRERKKERREREEGRRGRNVFCDGASPFEDYFDFSAAAYTLSCWQL